MLKFIMTSLAVHAAAVVILNFVSSKGPLTENVEVVFQSAPERPSTKSKSIGIKNNKISSSGKRSIGLKELGLGSNTSNLLKEASSGDSFNDRQVSANWKDPGSYASNDLNSFDGLSVAQAKYTTTLWRKINQAVESPSYLSEYNHTGKIHLRFEIDENGFLKEEKLRACGDDNVLKVLAVRALRKAILDESKELQNFEANTQFFAQFSWADHRTCQTLKGINKNYLSFCHYAENKRKEFTASEKTVTYLKALNYGPGMFEEIEKYQKEEKHRKNGFDPFAQLRTNPDWNLGC